MSGLETKLKILLENLDMLARIPLVAASAAMCRCSGFETASCISTTASIRRLCSGS